MTIKKVSSIAKLEDLGRIQLSKSFFMRELLIPLLAKLCFSPLKRETCHVINLIRVVPSPERVLKQVVYQKVC